MADESDLATQAGRLDPPLEAAVEQPEEPPSPAGDDSGGFDFVLLAVLFVLAGLVAVQNVWLRRRAQRESAERGDT
ncbi:MAG: hypothetical protein ACQGVK_15550 [Myxococcota bacterium]